MEIVWSVCCVSQNGEVGSVPLASPVDGFEVPVGPEDQVVEHGDGEHVRHLSGHRPPRKKKQPNSFNFQSMKSCCIKHCVTKKTRKSVAVQNKVYSSVKRIVLEKIDKTGLP